MIQIAVETPPHEAAAKILEDGLDAYNLEQAGDYDYSEFVIGARENGTMVGGVLANVYWDAMFIKYVWIAKAQRRSGLGSKMIHATEEEGRKRGCIMSHLDTFSFQARGFYETLGYKTFGTLDWPGREMKRHYLSKPL